MVFLISSFPALLQGAHYKVFLLGGQSNALGRAPSSGLPTSPVNLQNPQNDVLFYYNSGVGLTTLRPGSGKFTTEFGPEVSFGRAIADAYPSDNIALIKYAAGGTSLYNNWAPGTGGTYTTFRNTVTAGLAAIQAAGHTTEIVGMAWHQGESDAIAGQQANYQANLTAFIADIRSNYGAALPFLIGEIRRSNGPAFVTVADAQIAVAAADPNAIFVPASDLSFSDTYHFDAPSQVTLGERFASGYVTLDTGVPPLLLTGITDDQGGGPVVEGTTVSYTLTFSADMDASTLDAVDFENAGTAAVSWGAISEVAPGVFTLALTADSPGTLQLQVVQDAELLAENGSPLDTTAPIADETVITVTESGSGGVVAGTVIGVDFFGTPDGNFNGVGSNGTITDLIDTSGATLTGVNLTTNGALTFNANADHTKTGQPSQFTEAHLTDWVVIDGGATYTITFAGLDDSLTYNLVIGGANGSNFNVNTTWSVDGQSDTTDAGSSSSTDGSGAFVSFTGLETDGSGHLVITGFKSSNYGVVSALELTAVRGTTSLASITDDQGGGPVVEGTTVSYTLTFNEDMDASTVDAGDFENAGTAAVSWGAISEVAPGVFTLALTADSPGTLQLQVVQDAELLAEDGNPLDTTAPIADETVITVTESGSGGIVAGTVIGVDFAGTPNGNFNGVTSDGTITDLIDTTGATLTGVNLTTSGRLTFNANADHTKTGQPSQFTEAHLTDWVVFSGGVTYTITFAGLNDSLTYDLVIGGANGSNFNVNTTWTVDGQSDTTAAGTSSSTDGSGAFVSLTGLKTDGSGDLVITGFKSTNYGVACALELTAVPANTFATWIANPAFGLDSGEQGLDLDPDGDGIANGVESWFGTHPGQFSAGLAGLVTDGIRTTCTHPKSTSPPTDLEGFYQWSPNLSDWYAGDGVDGPGGGPTVTISADNAEPTTTVTATAIESMGRLFLRVRVTQN